MLCSFLDEVKISSNSNIFLSCRELFWVLSYRCYIWKSVNLFNQFNQLPISIKNHMDRVVAFPSVNKITFPLYSKLKINYNLISKLFKVLANNPAKKKEWRVSSYKMSAPTFDHFPAIKVERSNERERQLSSTRCVVFGGLPSNFDILTSFLLLYFVGQIVLSERISCKKIAKTQYLYSFKMKLGR